MNRKCSAGESVSTASRNHIPRAASFAMVVSLLLCAALPLRAQSPASGGGRHEIFAGSELENYLRYLQTIGRAASYPWSLRPFSPQEVNRLLAADSVGPWSARYDLSASPRGRKEFSWIAPSVSARFNSGFPYGYNDGPIWAGRGLTTSAEGGFFLRLGPASLTIAPMVFRAENASYQLEPASAKCPPSCANGLYPTRIDLPQRFGNSAYQRFDPGQSTLRLDGLGISAGITTANEWWGPAQLYPYLLGDNAPGFPHVFIGSGYPINIYIGQLHGRVLYGRLDQSAYSPVTGSKYYSSLTESGRVRFASGAITVFEPRGLPGLEVGVARFVHSIWPSTGIPSSYYRRMLKFPLSGFHESGGATAAVHSNQLASGFFRWLFPNAHVDVYGEYGAEDSHYDLRGSLQEPDYTRAYSLGMRRVWNVTPAGFDAIHFELMNYQESQIQRYRTDDVNYIHDLIRQGHTNRGQLLGSPLGPGAAAGATLSWDRYTNSGRTSIALERVNSQDSGDFYRTGIQNPRSSDISEALRFERVKFLRSLDLTSGATLVREFNRNFAGDAWNVNLLIGARYHP